MIEVKKKSVSKELKTRVKLKTKMTMQFSTTKVCYLLSTLLSLTTLFDVAKCHVGLSFPPARKYDLDFLDNVRTKPPCGMPKGRKSFLLQFLLSCCHILFKHSFSVLQCVITLVNQTKVSTSKCTPMLKMHA